MAALQTEAGAGNVDIIRPLNNAGADIKARGVGRRSALVAAENRGYEVIEQTIFGY